MWTGNEMIVWGGRWGWGFHDLLDTGGRYDPATDSWLATSTAAAPLHRSGHTAVWTGSEMLVWAAPVNTASRPATTVAATTPPPTSGGRSRTSRRPSAT